jgi:hypothetical protein
VVIIVDGDHAPSRYRERVRVEAEVLDEQQHEGAGRVETVRGEGLDEQPWLRRRRIVEWTADAGAAAGGGGGDGRASGRTGPGRSDTKKVIDLSPSGSTAVEGADTERPTLSSWRRHCHPRTKETPMKTLSLPWTMVAADSTTEVFLPATGWMQAADVAKIRTNFELRGVTGTINVLVGYQTANVENSPDAATNTGTFQTSVGVYFGGSFTDVSAATQAKQLIRFGFVVKLTSGFTLSVARAGGSVDIIKPA